MLILHLSFCIKNIKPIITSYRIFFQIIFHMKEKDEFLHTVIIEFTRDIVFWSQTFELHFLKNSKISDWKCLRNIPLMSYLQVSVACNS